MIEMLVFDRINEYRKENGIESLSWSNKLARMAKYKAELISHDFSHNAMGMNAYRLLRNSGIYFVSVGENIYRITGLTSLVNEERIAEKCMEGWRKSKGHRRVMLSEFTHCGVGAYAREKSVYIAFIAVLSKIVIESEFSEGQTLLLQPVDEGFIGKVRIEVTAYPKECFTLSYPEYVGKDDFIEVDVRRDCEGRVIIKYLDV